MEEAPLPENEITLTIDDVKVRGRIVKRTNRLLVVKLVELYGRLAAALTIPLFAVRFTSFDGEHGDRDARILLTELYRKAVLFYRHSDQLCRMWRLTQKALIRLDEDHLGAPATIAATKRRLRLRMRSGEITSRAYQQSLRPLRCRERAYEDLRQAVLARMESSKPWSDAVDLKGLVSFLGEDATGLRQADGLTRTYEAEAGDE